jgi:two-component system LytT family sensor kinase
MDHPLSLPPTPFSRRHLAALWYVCALVVVALLQGSAELQHYLARGGRQPWEPYLWEFSSVCMVGALAPLVYRWHVAGLGRGLWWRHALGALGYTLTHVGGMFAIRFGAYALAGQHYDPGNPVDVLSYEAGKDAVSYAVIAAICHGIHLYLEAQRRELELERMRGELAESRLARLSEQLNPHFLFNSLNLISAVMYEDVARADRLLCDLATLLRQTLAAQQAAQHSLDEELTLIAPYLTLMQARFGARLRVTLDASAAARRCQVPTLLLMSPVENAIKHDVAHSGAEVDVSIRAWCDGAQLHLTVDNSGMAPQRTERKGGIGLDNVRARLQAFHGAHAQVTLQARDGGGSRLHIDLPAVPEAAP